MWLGGKAIVWNVMAHMDSVMTGLEGKIDSTRKEIVGEITLVKWMLGTLIGLCVTILVKLLFA